MSYIITVKSIGNRDAVKKQQQNIKAWSPQLAEFFVEAGIDTDSIQVKTELLDTLHIEPVAMQLQVR